jgi:ADP-L-glycero-D-manno-heptose 6-epimerase
MILLTGGAGFIGSCFLKTLNDNGIDDIVIIDQLGTGEKWKNLVGKKYISLIDKETFTLLLEDEKESAFSDLDAIIHLGACTNTTERDADYLYMNNFMFSKSLASFALENDIRFIYASSAATYGSGDEGYSDNNFDNLKPLNMYGFSKHLFDMWVIENELDTELTGLKFFNVFGPNEYHKGEMASMIYKSYNQIKANGSVNLFRSYTPEYADGEQKRDFIYVKDVCDVLDYSLNDKSFKGIFNLGTGKPHSWNELIGDVFKACKLENRINYIDMPVELRDQYQYYTAAEMTKLRNAGYKKEFTNLGDAVGDYVNNYLQQSWKNL